MNATMFRSVQVLEKTMGIPLSQVKRSFKPGDPIRVKWHPNNPFAMWGGRFERLDGKGRLRVLLAGLSREVPVTLPEDLIEPV